MNRVKEFDKKQLAEICHLFRINLVVLFGSRARGWENPKSDYDIGVWIENCPFERNWKQEAAIWEAFADLLKTDKLDLIILNRANGALSYEVACYGIPIYEGIPFAFQKFQVLATKRCEDMKRIDNWNRLYIQDFLERRGTDAQSTWN